MNEDSHVWLWRCGFIFLDWSRKQDSSHLQGRGESRLAELLSIWCFLLCGGCWICQGAVECQQQLQHSLYRPWDPLVCDHADRRDFYGRRNTSASHCVPLPPYLPLSFFFFFLNPCMLPTCSRCLIQSSELLIQFSIKCVERCCRLPSCYVSALCFPPQGHFTNLFDLRL